MASETKSYRKFLATSVTAAAVTAVAASSVTAEEEQTINATSFTDVESDMYYTEAVNVLDEAGIIRGYTEETFGVGDELSRAQAATFISRFLQWDTDNVQDPGFPDVDADDDSADWYYEHVAKAVEEGVIQGREDGTFDPEAEITRGETAAMLVRALDLDTNVNPDHNFTDIDNYYEDYIEALYAADITTGVSETEFGTTRDVLRQDFATFLHRAGTWDSLDADFADVNVQYAGDGVVEVTGSVVDTVEDDAVDVALDLDEDDFDVDNFDTASLSTTADLDADDSFDATLEVVDTEGAAADLTEGDFAVELTYGYLTQAFDEVEVVDEDINFQDIGGAEENIGVPGAYNFTLSADAAADAGFATGEGETLTLYVDGQERTLEFDAEENEFFDTGAQGIDTDAIAEAVVAQYEEEEDEDEDENGEDGDDNGEEDTGDEALTIEDVNAEEEEAGLPGLYNVYVSFEDAEAAGLSTEADAELTLHYNDGETQAFEYDADNEAFVIYGELPESIDNLENPTVEQ
ncbi:S-layer family protein [Salsuginibacillus halophilus]|uniref:S-layer family protein n=1 Tax=Salsuginibacillus halophilus TaxID=517424 RepID=A0A2P8H3M3_9BACI|nr:S-layer homology domain-containing protein [Salsuginibacillus halophilus]PSL40807.1 S-layer family protein [Salsuginibacillus halophilus]